MRGQYSPEECVQVAIRAIDAWTEKGMCYCCALIAVADKYGITKERLEDVYIDRKARAMFSEHLEVGA